MIDNKTNEMVQRTQPGNQIIQFVPRHRVLLIVCNQEASWFENDFTVGLIVGTKLQREDDYHTKANGIAFYSSLS